VQLLGKHDRAISNYEAVLAVDPNHLSALINLAIVFNICGGLPMPWRFTTDCPRLTQTRTDFSQSRVILLALERFEEALASSTSNRKKANYSEAFHNRGTALHELRRFDEALSDFDKVISLEPNNAEAFHGRGIALLNLKQFDEALPPFDKVISKNKDHADAHLNQSIVHLFRANFPMVGQNTSGANGQKCLSVTEVFPSRCGLARKISREREYSFIRASMGDTIHFCRYVPLLQASWRKGVICSPALVEEFDVDPGWLR